MKKTHLLVLSSVFFLFLVLVDQLFKYLIRFFGGFYLCNSGIAWGIKLPQFLFWIFWTVVFFFFVYLTYKELFKKNVTDKIFLGSLILVLSGTIGNFIDRLFFNCIIDFINLKIWPVFNLADCFIAVGVIMLLFKELKSNIKNF